MAIKLNSISVSVSSIDVAKSVLNDLNAILRFCNTQGTKNNHTTLLMECIRNEIEQSIQSIQNKSVLIIDDKLIC